MLWIYYLVGINYFAMCRENRRATVWEMLIGQGLNLLRSPIPQWWGNWKSDPESVSRIESPPKVNQFLQLVGPIITPSIRKSADYFCSNPAHMQRKRTNERQTNSNDHTTPPWRINNNEACDSVRLYRCSTVTADRRRTHSLCMCLALEIFSFLPRNASVSAVYAVVHVSVGCLAVSITFCMVANE